MRDVLSHGRYQGLNSHHIDCSRSTSRSTGAPTSTFAASIFLYDYPLSPIIILIRDCWRAAVCRTTESAAPPTESNTPRTSRSLSTGKGGISCKRQQSRKTDDTHHNKKRRPEAGFFLASGCRSAFRYSLYGLLTQSQSNRSSQSRSYMSSQSSSQ